MVAAAARHNPLERALKYQAITPLDKAEAGKMLLSGDEESIMMALLGAAEGDAEWRWVQEQCLRFINDPRETVARGAVMALGNLARHEGQLDLDIVVPAIKARRQKASGELLGACGDALSDIKIFCRKGR